MSIRKIVTIPNKTLDKPCKAVTEVNSEILDIVTDLKDTLGASKVPGAGIAANQVGLDKRVCIVRDFNYDSEGNEAFSEYVLINPEFKPIGRKESMDWEGCLSVPDTYGLVNRYKKIKVKYLDMEGNSKNMTVSGYFARTIQHEIDHLSGILFTSKVVGNTKTEKELDKLFSDVKKLA